MGGARTDESDDPGPSSDQSSRRRVGSVSEPLDSLLNALSRLRSQARGVVDDARDGLVRDAGEAGDIGHDDSLVRSRFWARQGWLPSWAHG